MDKEEALDATLDQVAGRAKTSRKVLTAKRRRHSAPQDAAMAKMFAKDLRSILTNPGKPEAAEGEDAEMVTEEAPVVVEGDAQMALSFETEAVPDADAVPAEAPADAV